MTTENYRLHFSDEYLSMNNITEALYRTAMVRTLSQIQNVSYISFYVGDKPVTLSSGVVLNNMTSSQYVTTDSDKMYEYSMITTTLYFADKKSNKLVRYSDDIAYTKEKSMEELIVNKLIEGIVLIIVNCEIRYLQMQSFSVYQKRRCVLCSH